MQAQDRVAVLRALNEQGHTPLSVVETAASDGGGSGGMRKKAFIGVALAGVAIFVGSVTSVMRRSDGGADEQQPPSGSVIGKPSAPVPTSAVIARTPPLAQAADTPPVAEPPVAAEPGEPDQAAEAAVPVEAGLARRTGPGAPGLVLVPGMRRSGPTNAPNPLATLRTTSERVMSQLLRTRPGDPVIAIPLGKNFAQDFAAALANQIEIYETDSEQDADHKIAIGWMKESMREMVEEGASPEEILVEYRKRLNDIAALRLDLQHQLNALKAEGDMAEAEAFVAEANKELGRYGARPLAFSLGLPNRVPRE